MEEIVRHSEVTLTHRSKDQRWMEQKIGLYSMHWYCFAEVQTINLKL